MPTAIQETAGQLHAKRNRLGQLFEKKTADGRFDWTAAERDEAKALNDECDTIGVKLEGLRADEAMEVKHRKQVELLEQVRVPGTFEGQGSRGRTHRAGVLGHDGAELNQKSIGEYFIESKSFTSYKEGYRQVSSIPDLDTKTLFQTSAGWDPFVPRLPKIALSPQQKPRVVDLLPTSETQFHSIKWMLETVYVNASAPTAEGGAYPEAQLQYVEQLSPVQKVSVFIPATDEQFEDAPRTRDLLNNRLELMLRQRLDLQLVGGNGTAPNLTGLLAIVGIQTQAKGTDPAPSAIFKAMTLVKTVGFAEPSGVLMNPTDWQNIKLLQTADGLYIWGHPSADTPNRIWGLPVVDTTYMTLGSSIVGDFAMHTELIYRRGIEFLVSNSHQDFFTSGKLAIRADMRAAFICDRPKALVQVTGL